MIVAVTGTKGKTTVVSMINHALSMIGSTTSAICTLGFYKGLERRTKKSRINVYEDFLAREMHTDFQCIEATSHLLRIGTIPDRIADVVVLTGVERGEHDDLHPLFKEYVAAKRKIYDIRKPEKNAIVCADGIYFSELTRGVKNVITYGFKPGSDLEIKVKKQTDRHASIEFYLAGETVKIKSLILGNHNYLNLAASYLALVEMGVESQAAVAGLSTFSGAPGRFERFTVNSSDQEKIVIIDYAHTPSSLKNTLILIKELYPGKKVCTVFGCGGDRSVTKRPLMGREATVFSDVVIVTNDNPREESPERIVDDILTGAEKACIVEMDREKAISASLEAGCEIILLAGKGAEEQYIIGDKIYNNRSDKTLLQRVCLEKSLQLTEFILEPGHI